MGIYLPFFRLLSLFDIFQLSKIEGYEGQDLASTGWDHNKDTTNRIGVIQP